MWRIWKWRGDEAKEERDLDIVVRCGIVDLEGGGLRLVILAVVLSRALCEPSGKGNTPERMFGGIGGVFLASCRGGETGVHSE